MLNNNQCDLLGSRLGHFFQQDPGVLCPLGLQGVQVVQEGPRGSLSIRPKGRRDTSSLNQTIRVVTVPSPRWGRGGLPSG